LEKKKHVHINNTILSLARGAQDPFGK